MGELISLKDFLKANVYFPRPSLFRKGELSGCLGQELLEGLLCHFWDSA